MSLKVAAGFCQRFGTGFRAGVDVLTLCGHEAKHGSVRHREAMMSVLEDVKVGTPMARAMLNVDKYFPPLLVQMVHIGEQSGRLERTLLELSNHYDHQIEIRRTFLRGIAWPMLQMIGGIFVIGLFLLITEMLGSTFNPIGLSFAQYVVTVIVLAVIAAAIVLAVKVNAFGVQRLFSLVYRIPKLGESLQTIMLARICWTLSLTLDSGLDALRSVKMSLQSTQNDYYACHADEAVETIKNGGTMEEAFRSTGLFPDEFLHYIEVAEISGTDAEALDRLAGLYDARAKMALSVITGILTGGIWASVVIMLVFVILRMALAVQGVYNDALAPI